MKLQAEVMIPTPWGEFNMIAYSESDQDKMPHLAMVHENFDPSKPTYVRIHSECLTGDLFGSFRCDCGEQLDAALAIAAEEGGMVIYLRQEGRGIGLINKLKAYQLQDKGLNTVDANTHLGLEVDGRQYEIAIQILKDMKVENIHLITNNPLKIDAIEASPINLISRVPLMIPPKDENKGYLKTKKDIMGHLLNGKLD